MIDLGELHATHRPVKVASVYDDDPRIGMIVCNYCWHDDERGDPVMWEWPCDAARLLQELDVKKRPMA